MGRIHLDFLHDTPEGFLHSPRYYNNDPAHGEIEFGGGSAGGLVDKDATVIHPKNGNYFFEHGNLGFLLTAGHGNFQNSLAFFQDACERLYFAPGTDFVFVVSHWNEVYHGTGTDQYLRISKVKVVPK